MEFSWYFRLLVLVDSHKWVSVQSDCGLTSKSLQNNFSQSHLIVERLFNKVLKIRQNPSSKTLRTMAVKITIFSSYHGKPSFSKITTSDNRSHIYYIYIYIAQVTQQCVCLRILFPRRFPSFIFFYSTVFKRGNSPKSVNVFKKKTTTTTTAIAAKNVVGIVAVLMACTVKPATKNLKIKNLLA